MAFSTSNTVISPQQRATFFHHTRPSIPRHHHKAAANIKLHFHTPFGNVNTCRSKVTPLSAVSGDKAAMSDIIPPQQSNTSIAPSTPSASWSDFAKNISGEWDGFGADFDKEGEPLELPESVVPEAYREWEVKVFDWQTQCPTLALPEDIALTYNLIRLLPTVGCEADAATKYSIDERNVQLSSLESDRVSALAFSYQSSGCYAAIWPLSDHNSSRILEVEHCLIDPRDRESRVRVIQVLRSDHHKLELQSIKVFCEQWYGPFRNGDQLGGCAIRDSAFATTKPLERSQVIGAWEGLKAVANFHDSEDNIIRELADDCVHKFVRDERDLILLPRHLWCSLRKLENGDTCSEAGWILDKKRGITSKCIFSDGAELKEIHMASETATGSE